MTIHWRRIDTEVSFSDPESHFEFGTLDAGVELYFRDWRNRLVHFLFENVSHFYCGYLFPQPDCPGDGLYSIDDSQLIERLRESGTVGSAEPALHLVVATNEDEWCEVVTESYRIEIGERS